MSDMETISSIKIDGKSWIFFNYPKLVSKHPTSDANVTAQTRDRQKNGPILTPAFIRSFHRPLSIKSIHYTSYLRQATPKLSSPAACRENALLKWSMTSQK